MRTRISEAIQKKFKDEHKATGKEHECIFLDNATGLCSCDARECHKDDDCYFSQGMMNNAT